MPIRIGYADTDCSCRYVLVMPIQIGYAEEDWLYRYGLVMRKGIVYAEEDWLYRLRPNKNWDVCFLELLFTDKVLSLLLNYFELLK